MAKAEFKCGRCGRTFKMKAHLARHLSASHGVRKRKGARKKVKVRRGRRRRAASPLRLQDLSLEQLGELINIARSEARRRIASVRKAMR
jgi:uncharacterized C2H2 Zn-finger protein